MALQLGLKHNFEQIMRAALHGDLCIMECRERESGMPVTLLCAVHPEGNEFCFTPFARMLEGDPYADYIPPAEEDGEEEFANG